MNTRKGHVFSCLGFAGLVLFYALRFFDISIIDDSYITYVYSKNLAAGHGLTYNVLDAKPVEGYSNFLWMLLHVPFVRFVEDPIVISRVFGFILLVACLLLGWRLAKLVLPSWRLAPLVLAFGHPAIYYWTFAGLEVPLFAFLVLLGTWRHVVERRTGGRPLSGVVWLALCMTRVDGLLVVAVFYLVVLWNLFRQRREAPEGNWYEAVKRRGHLTNLGVLAAGLASYQGFRLWYFREWLPNTYYTKVQGNFSELSTGLQYAGEFVLAYPWVTVLLLAPFAYRRAGRHTGIVVLGSSSILLAYASYVVRVGGDWMPLFRYFVPFVPLAAIGAVACLTNLSPPRVHSRQRLSQAFALGLIFFPVYALFQYVHSTADYDVHFYRYTTKYTKEFGKSVARQHEGITTGNTTAGAFPYFSGFPNIDLSGVCDRHIARQRSAAAIQDEIVGHKKGDGDYVARRGPQLLIFHAGLRPGFSEWISDTQLFFNLDFRAHYEATSMQIETPQETFVVWSPPIPDVLPLQSRLRAKLQQFRQAQVGHPGTGRVAFVGQKFDTAQPVQMHYFRRLAPGEVEADAFRRACRAIAAREAEGRFLDAVNLLERYRPVFEGRGELYLYHTQEARLRIQAGDVQAARTSIDRALRSAFAREARLGQAVLRWVGSEAFFEELWAEIRFDARP